ncbi:unnamed protein product [Citrullus colocynthis]|uniref:Uncharacterized protein n=1 Tax=Citrullus colocynthis TaxID=252529 RepID=A0ABP0Y3Q6_9ROSI
MEERQLRRTVKEKGLNPTGPQKIRTDSIWGFPNSTKKPSSSNLPLHSSLGFSLSPLTGFQFFLQWLKLT